MKRYQLIGGAVASMAFGAIAWGQVAPTVQNQTRWIWPAKLEAVEAAPRNHKVLFEDGHVSLLEVTIRPGETENMHGHMYPSVFAYDAEQPAMTDRKLDGSTRPVARNYTHDADFPACRTMGIQAPHQVTINDPFPQHFYRLQFKHMDKTDTAAMKYGQGS